MDPYIPVTNAAGYVPSGVQEAPVVRAVPFQFGGNAKEYFRIWIVNTLLTIVTLGIYSAWAKIRTKRYFYRNTSLEGASFDYLASPIPILKGRIIAAVALGLLFGSQYYSPVLYAVLLILYVLATPWVVVKALAFNARNSSYRNVRFAFTGRTGEAAGLYLGMVLLQLVSCGIAAPYAQWRMTSFIVTRHLYGDLRLEWGSTSGAYYRAYVIAVAMTLPIYAVFGGLLVAATLAGDKQAAVGLMVPLTIGLYALLLIPAAYLNASLANLVYGGIALGPHRLECNQRWTELLKIYAVNLLGIGVSLGLLIPWAKIRLAAFRAKSLTLHVSGTFLAEALLDEEANALGEGMSDLGDFDVGIGA
jgi:uncharacterized membrane protein YjgN (DUF898 family)